MTGNRLSKEELLQKATDILGQNGPEALTIDRLCKSLNVTKGSFYHHFKGREGFIENLMEYWLEEFTIKIIDVSEKEADPAKSRDKMIMEALMMKSGPEKAIRAWGKDSPTVASYVERADKIRLDYLQEIFMPYEADPERRKAIALTAYTTFLGSMFIYPELPRKEHLLMIEYVSRAFGVPIPATGENHETAGRN